MALTLRVGVPPTSEVSHHLTAGQVTVKVLETVQKELNLWSEQECRRRSPLLTINSRTLLDTATLKGWNLLMAEKAESSTSVCGSLRETGQFFLKTSL